MLKIALVGCGRIAYRHAEVIKGLAEKANLVAVCDLDKERALQIFQKNIARPLLSICI